MDFSISLIVLWRENPFSIESISNPQLTEKKCSCYIVSITAANCTVVIFNSFTEMTGRVIGTLASFLHLFLLHVLLPQLNTWSSFLEINSRHLSILHTVSWSCAEEEIQGLFPLGHFLWYVEILWPTIFKYRQQIECDG